MASIHNSFSSKVHKAPGSWAACCEPSRKCRIHTVCVQYIMTSTATTRKMLNVFSTKRSCPLSAFSVYLNVISYEKGKTYNEFITMTEKRLPLWVAPISTLYVLLLMFFGD